jgi:hypothetical protein
MHDHAAAAVHFVAMPLGVQLAHLNAVSWFLKARLMRSVPVKAAILMPTMLIVLGGRAAKKRVLNMSGD